MKVLSWVATILAIVGAINWGLWGAFQYNFVDDIFGGFESWASRVIYVLVGLAGLWKLKSFWSRCASSCHK